MTLLGLAWQAWAVLAIVFFGGRWWWRAVRGEWHAARRPTPPPVAPSPAACGHARVAPVVDLRGTLVAELCLDCDEQLDVRSPAWP